MKRIEDLTYNDVIHCETKKQMLEIYKLCPKNTCGTSWLLNETLVYYAPKQHNGTGRWYDLELVKKQGYTIHKAEEFLWKPKRGERVLVWDGEDESGAKERIFLCYIDRAERSVQCVNANNEKEFESGEKFYTVPWENMKPLPVKDEKLERIKRLYEETELKLKELGSQIENYTK